MLFNKYVHEYVWKSNSTSNIKNENILSTLSLSDVKLNLGDGPFSSDVGIVSLHPSKGTHWVADMKISFWIIWLFSSLKGI